MKLGKHVRTIARRANMWCDVYLMETTLAKRFDRLCRKLPVGVSRAKMENARDAALAPFKAATKAVEDADCYLQHVSVYIEQLGNEETGEWELGDWSERRKLAGRLRDEVRPLLIQKLIEKNMGHDDANRFIENWVDRNLDLTD